MTPIEKNRYFLLFANCVPVKGYNRSIIADLQRELYIYIPNAFYELLNHFKTFNIGEILQRNTELNEEMLASYLSYLLDYEMGMFVNDLGEFPSISTAYELPYQILDAIVELSQITISRMHELYRQFTLLGCQYLELRGYDKISIETIDNLLKPISSTRLRSVNLQIRHDENTEHDEYIKILSKYQIIGRLIIHSAPFNKKFESFEDYRLLYVEQEINNHLCCGSSVNEYKMINQSFYNESLKFNNCLHQKVSIDINGNILNCPSLKSIYGNIATDSIIDVIVTNEFKKVGEIGKDRIAVCKDCEYRYICSDCRAYLSDPYAKPLNCNYNPYTNTYETA